MFEQYAGARPSDAADHVLPVLRALQARGWAALPEAVQHAARGRLPMPGVTDPEVTVAEIRSKFDAALRKTNGEDFDHAAAIALYETGFRWVQENEATVVTALDAPHWLTDAYVGYATALAGLKRTEAAKESFREQIRSFPDLPITAAGYGPDAAAEYEAIRQEIDAAPHGTLLVAVDRPDAVIAIDNVGRGRGGNLQANVVAGPYSVLVQVGTTSRRYVVQADPATQEHAELRIDWSLDSKLDVTPRAVAIEGTTSDFGPELAKLVPGSDVVVLSIVESNGARWLVATRYTRDDGARRWRCAAELGSAAEASLPDCIVTGHDSAGVVPEIPLASKHLVESSSPSQVPAWLALGAATAAVGVGAYFAPDGHMKLQAGVSFGVAVVATAYMTYAYLRYANAQRTRRRTVVGVSLGQGGGVLTISGGF